MNLNKYSKMVISIILIIIIATVMFIIFSPKSNVEEIAVSETVEEVNALETETKEVEKIEFNDPAEELLYLLKNKEYGKINQLISKVGENNAIIMQNIEDIYNTAIEMYNNEEYSDAGKWMKVAATCTYLDSEIYLNAISIINNLNGKKLSEGQIDEIIEFGRKDLLAKRYQELIYNIEYQYKTLQGCYKSEPYYYYISGCDAYWGATDMLIDMVLYYNIGKDMWCDSTEFYSISVISDDSMNDSNRTYTRINKTELPSTYNDVLNGQAKKTIEQQNKEAQEWYEEYKKSHEENANKETPYEHYCEATNCNSEGTYTITGISGLTEYYCYTHYKEIQDFISKMEKDVAKGSSSKHICEECSKEGVYSIIGFSGLTEYYCTEHYNKMVDILNELLAE